MTLRASTITLHSHVQLTIGGPVMLVTEVDPHADKPYICQWFDNHNNLRTQAFASGALSPPFQEA